MGQLGDIERCRGDRSSSPQLGPRRPAVARGPPNCRGTSHSRRVGWGRRSPQSRGHRPQLGILRLFGDVVVGRPLGSVIRGCGSKLCGATERLPLARVTNLVRSLEKAKEAGWWVVGTVVDGGEPIEAMLRSDPPESMILVMGSEEKGLRRLVRERCDFLVTIGGAGELGSLNVSVAAAVSIALLGGAGRGSGSP